MNQNIRPISIPGIHDRFVSFFVNMIGKDKNMKVLDAGAGQGALTKRLHEEGFNISACDLFPERFKYNKAEFKKADLTKNLPYDDNSFDVIVAVEVLEHLIDHEIFFIECNRILKENGKLIISSPNILSLKSRFRFLVSGFFYSFKPLDVNDNHGLQHVSSLTLDQYNYLARKNGFTVDTVRVDKYQSTSKYLLWLWPFLYLFTRIMRIDFRIHNDIKLMLGRVLFIAFRKD